MPVKALLWDVVVVVTGPVVATCSSVARSERSCRGGAMVGDGRCRLLSRLGLPARGDRLHDQPDLVLPCCLGQDCRVPQHTVVQGILRLGKREMKEGYQKLSGLTFFASCPLLYLTRAMPWGK